MLPLKRRVGQVVVIDLGTAVVKLRILGARGRQAKLGFEAPIETQIVRVGARPRSEPAQLPEPLTTDK